MREPWFWRNNSLSARLVKAALSPAALAYQLGQNLRRTLTTPAKSSLPVVCIGNATLGGTGKTPFAILVEQLLREQGIKSVFLTRGYGGYLRGPVLVDLDKHDAQAIGDEPLLLARTAPVIVSAKRPQGAELAGKQNADVIIMDDGFQNPSLHKDVSILLTTENNSLHGEKTFPAGPFRETLASARKRADIVINISGCKTSADSTVADYTAWLEPKAAITEQKVIAFAGLGNPERFFSMLENMGTHVAKRFAFPDHHPYQPKELATLVKTAATEQARLITTEKDFVRLPREFQEQVITLPVEMRVNSPSALTSQIITAIADRLEHRQNAHHE